MTLLTEEEAKKRWCPFARYTLEQGGVTLPPRNRWIAEDTQLNPQPARCIASECMAWRWEDACPQGVVVPREPVAWISAGDSYAVEPARPPWMTDEWVWDQKRARWTIGANAAERGFCGLAGRPE